jgi:hypothetical protein
MRRARAISRGKALRRRFMVGLGGAVAIVPGGSLPGRVSVSQDTLFGLGSGVYWDLEYFEV